jgi:hypothetical protein
MMAPALSLNLPALQSPMPSGTPALQSPMPSGTPAHPAPPRGMPSRNRVTRESMSPAGRIDDGRRGTAPPVLKPRPVTRKEALDAIEALLPLIPPCLSSATFGEPCGRPCPRCAALRLLARTKRKPEVSR